MIGHMTPMAPESKYYYMGSNKNHRVCLLYFLLHNNNLHKQLPGTAEEQLKKAIAMLYATIIF